MQCESCGHVLDEGDLFCSKCGRPTPPVDPTFIGQMGQATGPLPAVGSGQLPGLPAHAAALVVRRGPGEGSVYTLMGDRRLAGRTPDADIFLDDVTVSRRHAEFVHQDGGWLVRDVGSLNGTYVNRERIDERSLTGGDEVQIGKYRFVFLEGDSVSAAS